MDEILLLLRMEQSLGRLRMNYLTLKRACKISIEIQSPLIQGAGSYRNSAHYAEGKVIEMYGDPQIELAM